MAADNAQSAIEADVLRCGYDVGYFDKSDIVRWADRQIAAMDQPSDALLDLAMIPDTHPSDVIKLLKSIHGDPQSADSIATQIGFLGICFGESRISLQTAIKGLYALVLEPTVSSEQSSQIYILDDRYDLAVAGTYGNLDDVESQFREFTMPYTTWLKDRCQRLFDLT